METLEPRADPGPTVAQAAPTLLDGQRLDQPTFHELYLRTPDDFRAELIDGVVHVMSSPVNPRHGRPDFNLAGFLYLYSSETPGTTGQTNTTVQLGPGDEVQPDCALLIDPESGGRTGEDPDGYTTGCPELVVEISSSSLALDRDAKRRLYEAAGALDYIVFDVPHRAILWFSIHEGRLSPMAIGADGLYRSRAFPGLWLDPDAFLRGDRRGVNEALRRGLDGPEHAAFIDRLRANRANRP